MAVKRKPIGERAAGMALTAVAFEATALGINAGVEDLQRLYAFVTPQTIVVKEGLLHATVETRQFGNVVRTARVSKSVARAIKSANAVGGSTAQTIAVYVAALILATAVERPLIEAALEEWSLGNGLKCIDVRAIFFGGKKEEETLI